MFVGAGIKLVVQGTVRAFWDEQRAYTKGSSGKLSHRNAEVCLDELVMIVSKSKYATRSVVDCRCFIMMQTRIHFKHGQGVQAIHCNYTAVARAHTSVSTNKKKLDKSRRQPVDGCASAVFDHIWKMLSVTFTFEPMTFKT